MLTAGVVERSDSEYCSPLVLVKKTTAQCVFVQIIAALTH
jgi:hypothetical protein